MVRKLNKGIPKLVSMCGYDIIQDCKPQFKKLEWCFPDLLT
jgi:hypothetical protein